MNPMQFLIACILLAACAVSAAQDCSDIAGNWQGTWSELDCEDDLYSGDWTGEVTVACQFTAIDAFGSFTGPIDPLTGILTTSILGTDCGDAALIGLFIDDAASGSWTYELGGGGSFVGSKVFVDTDGDGDPDFTDPDDDNDGIGDALDILPLTASNECTAVVGDDATLAEPIVADLTCAAQASINVQGTTQVMGPPAHLILIAPLIRFQSGFSAGRLTVISADPCPGCSP